MLVPDRLSAPFAVPAILSRQTLANLFWGDRPDPRCNLRQSLDLLTELFGSERFYADHGTVRALPGAFVTDIERVRLAYRKAIAAVTSGERLYWLIEAEGEMSGPFLEGCLKEGDQGEPWLMARRSEVHSWLTLVLLTLADAFEEKANWNGALDAARRAMAFSPESEQAQSRVWRLSEQAGQEALWPTFASSDTFEQVTQHIAERGADNFTGRETRIFAALYQAKLSSLPSSLQEALPGLAVLPSPFPAALAKDIVHVPHHTLMALSKALLLQPIGETFSVPEAVRSCALRTVSSKTRRQLEKRLALRCYDWVKNAKIQPDEPPVSPFVSVDQAEPFLCATLSWLQKQLPTMEGVDFIQRLPGVGLLHLAREAVDYLDKAVAGSYAIRLRQTAGYVAGQILLSTSEFSGAILRFEQMLSLTSKEEDWLDKGNFYFLLSNTYHYVGDSWTALMHLRTAEICFEQEGTIAGKAGCLRFRAEVQNHLGEFDEALQSCNEALDLRLTLYPPSEPIADALFWKGSTLFRLNRLVEAGQCIEEALSIWQETGEKNGIGFCLRLMGRLRAAQGSFAEAGAHLEHAILFHERAGDNGSRLAAVEARADVYFQAGRFPKALPLYEECLADYEGRRHQKGIARLQAKMESCSVPEQRQ